MGANEQDLDELMNAVQEAMENALADAVDDLVDNIGDSVQASVQNAIENMLASFEFKLPDGTQVSPIKKVTVTSPDKSRMFVCYGGLRVDGTTLQVQTRVDCWQPIHAYDNREQAVEALQKVKQAIIDKVEFIDL